MDAQVKRCDKCRGTGKVPPELSDLCYCQSLPYTATLERCPICLGEGTVPVDKK